ncbi:MAG: D-alanine--D-alanine ligase, partial [Bacteroidales bacterium]|nr:D-alanine--D-alanine ligase [Bacteroidales bacterium]
MEKKRIALVCGGFSKENVISVRSAATIAEHLRPELFETYRIVIDPDRWYYEATAEGGKIYDIDKNDFSLHLPGGKVTFDLALIIIHGDPGENGRLQGYFDMLHLPYTTCNACTSALTFNKAYCNAVLAHNGVRVAPSLHLFRETCTEPAQREAAIRQIT